MQRLLRNVLSGILRSLPGSLPAAALLAFAPAALAQPMGPPHGGPGGPGPIGHYLMLVHKAGMSDSQQQQITALVEAGRSASKSLFDQIRTGHQALDAKLYGSSTPTASDLATQTSQLAQLHAQLDAAELQTVLKIRALLSADQLTTVNSLHDKMESLHQQMDELVGPPGSGAPASVTP